VLGDTGLFDPQGLYPKDTVPRSGKPRGPMIVADRASPIAEFGFSHSVKSAAAVDDMLEGRACALRLQDPAISLWQTFQNEVRLRAVGPLLPAQ
jgi:hypothetical protein